MDGFICIDKPCGPSSFAIVHTVRKKLKIAKTGHAGTLDPMASGLLVIALGRCTRLLEYLTLEPKVYEFSVVFGRSTDTLDAEGDVIAESDILPSEAQLVDAVKKFTGDIEQIPPQYSAIKIGGTRAYELARKGIEVSMKPRVVSIYSVDLCGYDAGGRRAGFTVSCSAGTYVRSLARDIVKAADPGAEGFVNILRRTRTGRFDLSTAVDYQSLKDSGTAGDGVDGGRVDINRYIISTESAFDVNKKVVINDNQRTEISKGRGITFDKAKSSEDILVAFDGTGSLSAVLKRVDGNRYHPDKVFISADNKNTLP